MPKKCIVAERRLHDDLRALAHGSKRGLRVLLPQVDDARASLAKALDVGAPRARHRGSTTLRAADRA